MAEQKHVRSRLLGLWALLLIGSSAAAGAVWLKIDLVDGYSPQRLELTGLDLNPTVSAILMLQACILAVVWFVGRVPRIALSLIAAATSLFLLATSVPLALTENSFSNAGSIRAIAKVTGIADAASQSTVVHGWSQDWTAGTLALLCFAGLATLQLLIALNRKPWAAAKSYERAGSSESKSTSDSSDSAQLWDSQG